MVVSFVAVRVQISDWASATSRASAQRSPSWIDVKYSARAGRASSLQGVGVAL